ncbi:hypothetical protein [Methanoregula sp.]|jgi:hypothetical protein|uniref:hypothetical protein n=1 Tax=Methanoregula sp. TaxID=2052170 RepID=UPI0025FF5A21|nr:hypothetical protein [Methanoregula sp.]
MKLMHCTSLFFLAAGLVVVLCLCAACISGPSEQNQIVVNNTPVTNGGFVQIAGTSSLQKSFTLEDAASAVIGNYQDQVNGSSQNLPFYYIRGENVDTSGHAERWIFGVREGKIASLLVYDHTGVARIAWQEDGLPDQEINIAGILSPADIITIANSGNQTTAGNLTLEISRGEYTVTEPSGSHPREYLINATTGVLITTHD